jgi:hypothetical protein
MVTNLERGGMLLAWSRFGVPAPRVPAWVTRLMGETLVPGGWLNRKRFDAPAGMGDRGRDY